MRKVDSVLDPLVEWHLAELTYKLTTYKSCRSLKEIEPEAWLRGNGTLTVNLGRQIGSTSYIARTASIDDVIFCNDPADVEYMSICRRGFFIHDSHRMGIHLIGDYASVDRTIQDVWVNDAHNVSTDDLDRLYAYFAKSCRRFILIG